MGEHERSKARAVSMAKVFNNIEKFSTATSTGHADTSGKIVVPRGGVIGFRIDLNDDYDDRR